MLLFIYSFLSLLIYRKIFCSSLNIWNFDKKTIKSLTGATFTGATSIINVINNMNYVNYFFSYDIEKSSYIENFNMNEKIEAKERLCSKSYTLNYQIQVLFTENNSIITYFFPNMYSKFSKVNIDDIKEIKSLKGITVNYNNEILVGFAGTNKMRLYKIVNNQLQTKTNFSVDGIIYDFIVLPGNENSYIYNIYILYYSQNNFIVGGYRLSDTELTNYNNYNLDIKLFENVEIYYSAHRSIIFSYKKNDYNFNYYIYEYGDTYYYLDAYGSQYSFLPFRGAKIINAFFLPDSQYLIYLIQIDKEKYAGVLDLINGLIIFNFKTITEFISYESNYLIYGDQNCLEKLCPFNNKNIDNCILPCSDSNNQNLLKITNRNENAIVPKCPNFAKYYLDDIYCYDECPSGYYAQSDPSGSKCLKCEIYDLDSKECVESCEENKIFEEKNGVCYSCKPFKMYKNAEINQCIDDCSKYNLAKEEKKSICISCKDFGKFFHNGKCENECGPHIKDEERGLCVECEGEKKFYEEGKCVKECSKYYTLDPKSRKCILCTKEEPFLQDGKCVKSCDDFHKQNNISKICINCQTDTDFTPYLQDNECVEKCSEYYQIDEEHKKCTDCKKNEDKKGNIFLQENECVESCDENHITNDINKYCINCQNEENGPYKQDDKCVSKCDKYYLKDDINKVCLDCKKNASGPYLEENKCVKECGKYHIVDMENKYCLLCQEEYKDIKPFFQYGECVDHCKENYRLEANQNICINCTLEFPETPYLQENKCLSQCNDYYVKDEENKLCSSCSRLKGENYYYFNNTCFEDCPLYSFKDEINKRCYKCDENPELSYYQDGQCVKDCYKYYYRDENLKICLNCSEIKNNSYFKDGKCVDIEECKQNYVINNDLRVCYNCLKEYPETPYYWENYNKCVEKCDQFHATDEDQKVCFKCHERYKDKIFNENGVCVEKCSEYFVDNEIEHLCIDCLKINKIFQDNKCVDMCGPGYTTITFPAKACMHCYKTYHKFEENGECTSSCTNYRVNNEDVNQCQYCKDFKKEEIYFYNNSCVDQCPIMYEKNKDNLICEKCLNYYDKLKQSCVDKCPDGSAINGMICEECRFYFKKNNSCVENCTGEIYPINTEKNNYSVCYECFCGNGNCLLNRNIKANNSEITDKYSCTCEDKLTFGKYCQYKKKKSNYLDKNFADNLEIKPLQDAVYANKRNIFTVEFDRNENINSLRKLLIKHEQFLSRRFEYFIQWKLIQENCRGSQNEDLTSSELFFVIEPGTFIDECENIIELSITNKKKSQLALAQLIVKTKSSNRNNFNINTTANGGALYILNNNYIKLSESNSIEFNYNYKYYYVTEDGEEFGLTDYMEYNDTIQNHIIPYCISIKARIKNDYGEILETEASSKPIYSTRMNTNIKDIKISSILEKMKSNEKQDKISIFNIIKDLKSFLYININYNINGESEVSYHIIKFINEYLPLSIINENYLMENNYAIDENQKTVDSNMFISLINQINLAYYNNYNDVDKEKNYEFYLNLTDIIHNSLNYTNIELLSEETILSYLRTIDNLLLTINQKKIIEDRFYNEIYDCINVLKNIIAKNVISGTKVDIQGNYFNLNLVKPGLYTEDINILSKKIKEETSKKNFMTYSNYKFGISKLENSLSKFSSESIFSISKNNYDYLYDEITYLRNEKILDLIISVSQIYNNNSFISRWNAISNNIYLNSTLDYPKQISDYSFIVEIFNPTNKNASKNIKKFRYNLFFDLIRKNEESPSDIICVALNSIIINNNKIEISSEENCITYIDSEKNKVICKCNTNGEVVLLSDKNLSLLTQNLFYQKKKYKIINSLNGSIILSSLALITIFSVSFIIYEFYEDKNNPIILMNISMRAQYEYESFKDLIGSSKYLFALYLIYYKYSFFNIFSTYKYNHPRYIRFFMEIIKILLNILISIIPLYYRPFKKNDEFISEFNSKSEEINNYPKENLNLNYNYAFSSFCYSLIASIIIFFITQFVYKLFEFKKMRRLIWKPKKDILKECVYGYFKKISMFERKIKNIKRRMLAYVRICGKYYLDNIKEDKFSSYLEYKANQQNSNKPIKQSDLYDSLLLKTSNSINIKNSNNKLQTLQQPLLNKSKTEKELKTSLIMNNSTNIKPNSTSNKKDEQLIISKGVQPFTLSQKATNIESLWNIYRLELIRNKYIFYSQNNEYYRDSQSKTIKYIDLAIETQKNYSYILSNDISFNQLSTTHNKKRINVIILINISLFITLLIIDIALIIVLKKIYEEYGNYIIINWLLPVLFQIIIVNFIINYIFAFIASTLLFFNYKRRKDCFSKMIFNIFVEKYMKYLFKIRTLINKYYREFENMK